MCDVKVQLNTQLPAKKVILMNLSKYTAHCCSSSLEKARAYYTVCAKQLNNVSHLERIYVGVASALDAHVRSYLSFFNVLKTIFIFFLCA